MEDSDRVNFAVEMSMLSSIYKGQQASALSESDLETWFHDLSPWPLEDLAEAIRQWRTDTTPVGNGRVLGEFMPRIANIVARLKIIGANKGYVFDHATRRYVDRPLLTTQVAEKAPVPPPKEFTEALATLTKQVSGDGVPVKPGEWTDEHRRIEAELDGRAGQANED